MKSFVKAPCLKASVAVLMLSVILHSQQVDSLPPDFFRFGFVLHEVCQSVNTFMKLFVLVFRVLR